MLINKLAGKNYFIALLILLALTTVLVLGAFALNTFTPASMGREAATYELASASYFEPWQFETENFTASYPEGGIIVTAEEGQNERSFLLIGKGEYHHQGKKLALLNPGGLLIKVDDNYFNTMRGSIIFHPIEDDDPEELKRLQKIVDQQKDLTTIWKEGIPVSFDGEENPYLYYFFSETGRPIPPPYINISGLSLLGSFVIYILFAVITFIVIAIFTLDADYSRHWLDFLSLKPGLKEGGAALVLFIFLIATKIFVTGHEKETLYLFAAYLLALLSLVLLNHRGLIDYLDLGLRRDRLKKGHSLAILIALLMAGAVKGLPKGFCLSDINYLLHLPVIFLTIAMPKELFWRGFILPLTCRKLNMSKAVVFLAILAGLSRLIILAVTESNMLLYPYAYLEICVLVPGFSVIINYLYLRTENVLATCLLHSLVLWLPNLIIY